jgi:hypothetical protein
MYVYAHRFVGQCLPIRYLLDMGVRDSQVCVVAGRVGHNESPDSSHMNQYNTIQYNQSVSQSVSQSVAQHI